MRNLQKYVRQVRPRNETYTPPVEKVQSFLGEAFKLEDIWKRDNYQNFIDKIIAGELLKSDGTTKFTKLPANHDLVKLLKKLKDEPDANTTEKEELVFLLRKHIGPCKSIAKAENGFSGAGGKTPKGEDWEALAVCGIRAHYSMEFNDGPEWERVEKFWGDYSIPAIELGKNMGAEFSIKDMEQWGSKGGIATSKRWKPAKNKTPKTDLKSGQYKISLKKYGGSQLMSGGPDESISTLDAAMTTYSLSDKGKIKIYAAITDIENKMGGMSEKGYISDLENKISAAKKGGKPLSTKDAASAAELATLRVNEKELNVTIDDLFTDELFKAHFCWEAATGEIKFKPNPDAAANELITFKETGTIANRMTLDNPEGAGAVLAKSNNFYVSFKTGGGGSKPYLSLRSSKARVDPSSLNASYIPTFKDILTEELYKENLLTEASEYLLQLDEFALWNTIKKKAKGISSSIINASKRIYDAVMKRVKEAFVAIKRLGERMWNGLLNFLGIEISKVTVRGGGDYPLL